VAKHALLFLLIVAAAAGLISYRISPAPFGYDESDYVYAAGFSPFAHWTDAKAMPIVDYVRIGLGRGLDQKQRLALSRAGRAVDDPDAYRHWHGPVYWYWLGFLAHFTHDEKTLRWWGLFFPILSALVIARASLRILPPDTGPIAALIASSLLLWSPVSLYSNEVAPHLTFVLCYLAALAFLAKVMVEGKRSDWYWAVVATGAAFCTMEVTFVLIATLLICAWRQRRALALDWRFAGRSVALFLATVLLLWPAAILKLTAAKAYLFMAYLSVFRKAPWGDIGFWGTWRLRFLLTPVEWLLILIGVVLFIRNRRRVEARAVEPFVWFSALMILAVAKVNTDVPRYSTPFMAALDVVGAWIIGGQLARFRPALRTVFAVAIIALLGIWSWHAVQLRMPKDDPTIRYAFGRVRSQGVAPVVVPQLTVPQFHYYAPAAQLQPFLSSWQEAFPVDSPSPVMVVTDDRRVFMVQCPRCTETKALAASATSPLTQ
jgi:Dolichyl-phosphate-mannose-protein mannosyltransferase